jgi:hypothetical protein
MESQYWPIIQAVYNGFNKRNIDSVFTAMNADVHWPRAFDGGYITGYDAVRAYWLKQWSEINPRVEPVSVVELPDGRAEVLVDQLVKDLDGNTIFEGKVKHVYTFQNQLIVIMDIG